MQRSRDASSTTEAMKRIENGALVRLLVRSSPSVSQYTYGTVLMTKYPMKDDAEWSDHLVLWHDGDNPSWEWCGDLEWVADE